jgi:hypothetical protein
MGSFEFLEELLCRPGSALTRVFEALTDALASVGPCCNIQQALVRLCVLYDCGGLAVDGQDYGALTLLDLLEKFARSTTESGEGLNV